MTGISSPLFDKGSIFHEKVKNNSIFETTTPKIVNLSSYDLTPAEISLLSKSLNFCPTPATGDLLDLEVNLRDFVRLLTLRDNFALSNDSIPDYLVRKTGETMPSDSKDMLFNGVIFNILKLSENLEKLPVDIDAAKPNITREERQALQTLKNNRNIIIKKADKGGGIVIMDTSYYVDKVNECLSNPKLYKKCDIKAVKTAMNKVKTFVTNNRKYFDGKNHEGRYIQCCHQGHIYDLWSYI